MSDDTADSGKRFRHRPLDRDHWTRQIAEMDPATQWADIYAITAGYEFPWESQRASDLALFHTFAVPAIGELLARTGEFTERTEKRYDDTAIVLVEAGKVIGGSTDDATAIRRLNRMHGAYDIPNDQMLYVLTTFVVVTRRFIDRYGYRSLNEVEVESMVRYWQRMGQLMGIRDIPEDYHGFAAYLDAYEEAHFGFSAGGRAVSDAVLTHSSSPASPLRPLVRSIWVAMLAPNVRSALRYHDSRVVKRILNTVLSMRRKVLATFPARSTYVSPLDRLPLRTYPRGYDIAKVGTFPAREARSG